MHSLNTLNLFQTERAWQQIQDQVFALVAAEHNKGRAQNGDLVKQLESTLAEKFNRKHCITVACCTDALVLSLQWLGLEFGARVGVSNYTFAASAGAIKRAGYSVVPVDINAESFTANVHQIRDVQAFVNVDLFGNMADWQSLAKLDIPVINDCAQSIESKDNNKWSAQNGLAGCLSFAPTKTISSWGSGGAILTDDDDLAAFARKARLHGKANNSSQAITPGLNSMLSSFEAACVLVGLQYSDQWRNRREDIAKYLASESKHNCAADFSQQQNTFHKLVFVSDNLSAVETEFRNNKVELGTYYRLTINDHLLYNTNNSFPVSDYLKHHHFSVPNQHTLTDSEVEKIAKALK